MNTYYESFACEIQSDELISPNDGEGSDWVNDNEWEEFNDDKECYD
jgi:hypothetical protein